MPYTRKLIYSPTSPLFSLSCTHAHTRTLILILTVCYKPPYPRSQTLVLLNDNPFPRHSPWRYKHRRRTKCIQRNLSCPHTRDIWFRVCLTFISLGDILFSLMVALESKATSFRTTKSKTPACLLTPTCLLRSMAPSIHLGKYQKRRTMSAGPPLLCNRIAGSGWIPRSRLSSELVPSTDTPLRPGSRLSGSWASSLSLSP
jgi:hypothetical protein